MPIFNTHLKQHIIVAITIYIIWVIGFSYSNFKQEKDRIYASLDQQLELAALATSLLLPKTLHHQDMQKDDLTTRQDHQNLLSLSTYADQTDITYIYTLILYDNTTVFTASSATLKQQLNPEIGSYFDVYDDIDPRVLTIFEHRKKHFWNIPINGDHFVVFICLNIR